MEKDVDKMTLTELKAKAKELGIKGVSTLKKDELIKVVEERLKLTEEEKTRLSNEINKIESVFQNIVLMGTMHNDTLKFIYNKLKKCSSKTKVDLKSLPYRDCIVIDLIIPTAKANMYFDEILKYYEQELAYFSQFKGKKARGVQGSIQDAAQAVYILYTNAERTLKDSERAANAKRVLDTYIGPIGM